MAISHWLPPQLHNAHEHGEERKVTWLELFYDLVYVATFIQLGNWLSANVSWVGFAGFVSLFIPVWWSWTGVTFYVNRFIVDDIWQRLIIFAQIFAIGAMAISVDGAFGDHAGQFALAYVAIRVLLILLYLRAGYHVPTARPLTTHYIIGFAFAALIWLISVFLPSPINYALWALGMIVDFAVPLSAGVRRLTSLLPPDVPHMSERYGLLTIIVLGETFVKLTSNASGLDLDLEAVIHGFFALVIACSLWWLYFDHVAGANIQPRGLAPYVWIYAHLPLTLGLIGYGVGITKLVVIHEGQAFPDKYRMLIAGSIAISLFFIGLIEAAIVSNENPQIARRRTLVRLIAALIILALALIGTALSPTLFITLAALVCIAQVALDLRLELQEKTADTGEEHGLEPVSH